MKEKKDSKNDNPSNKVYEKDSKNDTNHSTTITEAPNKSTGKIFLLDLL